LARPLVGVVGLSGVVTLQAFTAMPPSGVFAMQIAEGLASLPDDVAVALPLAGVVGPPGEVGWPGVVTLQAFTAMPPSGVFLTQIAEGLASLPVDVAWVLPLAGVDVVLANAAPPAPSMMARPPATTTVLRRVKDKGSSFPSAQTDCVVVNALAVIPPGVTAVSRCGLFPLSRIGLIVSVWQSP
jgi:hypothetical protein